MTDPRDFDRNSNMDWRSNMDAGTSSSEMWTWIGGVVFMFVLLGLIIYAGSSTQTARNDVSPPATTGQVR